jgi:hypothetical protein
MSTSIRAYVTREEIKDIVGLLGSQPNTDETVYIDATTVNGMHENPVSVERAYIVCDQKRGEEDFEPGDSPELFTTEYDIDSDEDTINAAELHEPDEDRRVAQEIISLLRERFGL